MSFFPVIKLKGKPFDMGLAHGKALANEIKRNFDIYTEVIGNRTGLRREKILELRGMVLRRWSFARRGSFARLD